MDNDIKKHIISLHKQNLSVTKIAESIKRSKSIVSRVLTLYTNTGKIFSPNKIGRLKIPSLRDDRIIQRMSLKDRFKTAKRGKQNRHFFKNCFRRLHAIGLFARCPSKKPLISKKNKTARWNFSNRHFLW